MIILTILPTLMLMLIPLAPLRLPRSAVIRLAITITVRLRLRIRILFRRRLAHRAGFVVDAADYVASRQISTQSFSAVMELLPGTTAGLPRKYAGSSRTFRRLPTQSLVVNHVLRPSYPPSWRCFRPQAQGPHEGNKPSLRGKRGRFQSGGAARRCGWSCHAAGRHSWVHGDSK